MPCLAPTAAKFTSMLVSRAVRTVAFALAASLVGLHARPAAAQAPGPQPGQTHSLFGQWQGNTEDDGKLTVVITSDRQLSYQFSGGKQEHNTGTFRLKGANQLLFTPQGATADDEETWVYTWDEFGRLKMEMEEDSRNDAEVYVLNRANP